MFIRMFVYASTRDEAEGICSQVLGLIEDYIFEKEIVGNEPYWKIEELYQIEISLKVSCKLMKKEIGEGFLRKIAESWEAYGSPVNEIVISRNTHTVLYDKIEMVDIHLDEDP